MAKDPKNFTGEDVRLLLKAEEHRLRFWEDTKMSVKVIATLLGAAVLILGGLGLFVYSLFR